MIYIFASDFSCTIISGFCYNWRFLFTIYIIIFVLVLKMLFQCIFITKFGITFVALIWFINTMCGFQVSEQFYFEYKRLATLVTIKGRLSFCKQMTSFNYIDYITAYSITGIQNKYYLIKYTMQNTKNHGD